MVIRNFKWCYCLPDDFTLLQLLIMKKKVLYTLLLLLLALASQEIMAQGCSMCKAVAETSVAAGNKQGSGLNAGILYIMVFPYILIGAGFYFWRRHRKQEEARAKS